MTNVSVTSHGVNFCGVEQAGVRYFHSLPYSHIPGDYEDPQPVRYGGDVDVDVDVDGTVPRPEEIALSVTAPAEVERGGAPVVIYIHGGRYETGTHEDPRADGTALAKAGILEVQLGYRVGLPGFVKFLDDEYFSYRGILDCQVGVEWVQRHIEAFGGDPTNVTLVGQSAGATTALWLCRKDHYRGGFRRVVAMSPCFPRQGFEHRKATLRQALGVAIRRDKLAALDSALIEKAYAKFRKKNYYDIALGPYPLQTQAMAEVPIVVTSTREEFYNLGEKADKSVLRRVLAWWAAPRFGMRREKFSTWADMSQDPAHPVGRLVGDALIRRWVEHVAATSPGPTWMMEFLRDGQPALHCQELRPLFGVTDSPLNDWLVRFARTGEAGFSPYRPDHAVWEFNLDTGASRTTYGALNYVAQAFSEE